MTLSPDQEYLVSLLSSIEDLLSTGAAKALLFAELVKDNLAAPTTIPARYETFGTYILEEMTAINDLIKEDTLKNWKKELS